MSWLFLAPLGIAITAFFIYERSCDEIAILSAVAAITGVLFGLILAPWQLQLVALLLGLMLSQKFIKAERYQSNSRSETDPMMTMMYNGLDRQRPFK
ncbi:hypothetical protein H6F90_02360 [Trichocoleus sp. FACHB-591]|uniref:hypothetical protein n=1 Tax=Trichocoleus sp. FACHB-591 TaxID=2692872 RepID=UPI001687E777|nr:hypothetical protein [Trichocoleus sp. FACHB-591]MBD2094000.1 hypothetical protein [Trichocoleus sp. FACHB-591]